MTVVNDTGCITSLECAAQDIAKDHGLITKDPKPIAARKQLSQLPSWLKDTREELQYPAPKALKAAEWLLDNAYIVKRAAQQVEKDLPDAFYAQLPALQKTDYSGLPRVYVLAVSLLHSSELKLTEGVAIEFINAYQKVTVLDMAELWALPSMLRLLCLQEMFSALERLSVDVNSPFSSKQGQAGVPIESLDDTECVARCISVLRLLSEISWMKFVHKTSVVESTLRNDPDGVYSRMDDDTIDRYRNAVEQLARGSQRTEVDVAKQAVEQALAGKGKRESHVGYWLIDDGRKTFATVLGYQPDWHERVRLGLLDHATATYLSGIISITIAALALPASLLYMADAVVSSWIIAFFVSLLPASILAQSVVNWLVTQWVEPRVLPKIKFSNGLDESCKTLVVIPTLLDNNAQSNHLLQNLERHYLSNPDPQLRFALATDFRDAPTQHKEGDEQAIEFIVNGIQTLNQRYAPDTQHLFHLLHRERRFNEAEDCWMGWERKRGKLEELNNWLAGSSDTSFGVYQGVRDSLDKVRYVITLDTDTLLPSGTAARLVGILEHPLNKATFDPSNGQLIAGFSIIQPRVEISPDIGLPSLFTRFYAGDTAIDIYSHAVSDAYQDFFGTGIFVGKGIYDVEAFRKILGGKIPDNAVLSHDLLEGVSARVALATDVILYEEYPPSYLAYAHRLHRWMRGDWQLLPWLGRRRVGTNKLSLIDRWKIVDNMRRSLVPPALLAFFVVGWLFLPASPLAWTLLAAFGPATDLFLRLGIETSQGIRHLSGWKYWSTIPTKLKSGIGRWVLLLVFLPYESMLSLDAIARTLFRLQVSKHHLLEWTTASNIAAHFADEGSRRRTWQEMQASPIIAICLVTILAFWNPSALPYALPLLLIWLLAPEIALFISRKPSVKVQTLSATQTLFVRHLARRTWLFFETFVGPDEHWLPPDNFQEDPYPSTAHRTSPTNIGMLLLSTLSANDLGYIGLSNLATRLENTFDTLSRLQRYRGHYYNWYNTHDLNPLPPNYVSSVDSGNLAAALIALQQGCIEAASSTVSNAIRWQGLADTLGLLREDLDRLISAGADGLTVRLREQVDKLLNDAKSTSQENKGGVDLLTHFLTVAIPEFERTLVEWADIENAALDTTLMSDVRLWVERIHEHVRDMQHDCDALLPWIVLMTQRPASIPSHSTQRLHELLPVGLPLNIIPAQCLEARDEITCLRKNPQLSFDSSHWLDTLDAALEKAATNAMILRMQLLRLAERAEADAMAMDFSVLYDDQKDLFYIGYDQSSDRMDTHHYDLMASEARVTSFLAIAKEDVPLKHWFSLGRPLSKAAGKTVLLSWGGTLFEYLMPPLLLNSQHDTLLAVSQRAAIAVQRSYAKQHKVPWGISESGYAHINLHHHYSYQAFGVPELGLKRGLADNLVIAPYASALALPLVPADAAKNLMALADLSLMGNYGFYEAADYTPDRVPEGRKMSAVKSYMAHHQGMILTALDNLLCNQAMVRRFHAHPRVQSYALLLHERVPHHPPLEVPLEAKDEAKLSPSNKIPDLQSWQPESPSTHPQAHLLGNGRLGSIINASGAGGLHWQQYAITRWKADTTLDDAGYWIYLRDNDTAKHFSATSQPVGGEPDAPTVTFESHRVESHRHSNGITLRMETTVAPMDDVEIRVITLHNQTDRIRHLSVASAAEVVLAQPAADQRHPAFSKLFIESEYLQDVQGLFFHRRPREPDEKAPMLLHTLIFDDTAVSAGRFETSRLKLLGREGKGYKHYPHLSNTAGVVLDPVMSLEADVTLQPYAQTRIAFMTLVGGSKERLLEMARRYQTLPALDWIMQDAITEARREAHRLEILAEDLPHYQQLLSLLLYPNAAMRCDTSTVAHNQMGQTTLWGQGVSGDYPILLFRVDARRQMSLLIKILRAQRLWKQRGVMVDIVVLWLGSAGYADDASNALNPILQTLDMQDWLGARGGVHLVRLEQISQQEAQLLEVAASVILNANAGSLAEQLSLHHESRQLPPAFTPAHQWSSEPPTPRLECPDDLLFNNGLGGFTADGREYVIHLDDRKQTPAPWCNILANSQFGSLVSESGLGYSWFLHSAENRLTPWNNDPVLDTPGEILYLRDEETAEIWSPTPKPVPTDSAYQVAHGAGYTQWLHNSHGIEQQLLVFVPLENPLKITRLRLRNTWSRRRRITATFYVEWVLGESRQSGLNFIASEYDVTHNALLARNTWNAEFSDCTAFLATNHEVHGFTSDRTEFLGHEGDRSAPAALKRWGLSNRADTGNDPCGAIQVHIDIEANSEAEVVFILGQGNDRQHALQLVDEWNSPDKVDVAFNALGKHWDNLLGKIEVQTPEPAMNVMLNRWLLYQTVSSRLLARCGFYQPGGAIGYRDQLQDAMALVHTDPRWLRGLLIQCAGAQFEEGDVLHWWHPPAHRGVRTHCSDDLLWLPYATAHYIQTTGDLAILDEQIPFLSAPLLQANEGDRYAEFTQGEQMGSLFEHCHRALQKGVTSGEHGLPLMGGGDWNDGMSRIGIEGRGESVWLGWFAVAAMQEFVSLCQQLDKPELANDWQVRITKLKQSIEESAWDGEWYVRAFDDDGLPWGAARSEECKIDSISQSWAMFSGAGNPERTAQALASAKRRLINEQDGLVLLLDPPFNKTHRDPGYIKGYPPGIRENGGQYTHAATWLGWAYTQLGDGDQAMRILQHINPIMHATTLEAVERYQVEPYVMAADIASVAPHVGRGGWTWYTGSAAWAWRLGGEAILGLRRVGDSLSIDPCIPATWEGFNATVYGQGDNPTRLNIKVLNTSGTGHGVKEVRLDGELFTSTLIPLSEAGAVHDVDVVL
ncbi:GH36-type glycosyl hydrolase domain-containing protein [Leucothrix arctica]|uniref:Cellobiose phosphorylase n=1 Tax=Leucothrix arctica TaxID=1481894 RepID=A0A317C6G5_9GAMM|nr:glucoamylase family protein [Leucothrix arctica]PWQ93791.1 cellobiose phosphorylase [Leucothrix arctica]